MTPFVIYQGAWNVMDRAFEREIIPMARAEGDYFFASYKADEVNEKKKFRHGSRSLECPRRRKIKIR